MSELARIERAELAGPRSGQRKTLTEPVDLGELRQRIEWMTGQSLPVGPLRMLDVRHIGSRVSVSRIPIEKDNEKCTPHALTERIAALVHADARNMPGAYQTYAIEAYYGDSHYPSEQARTRVRWDDDEDEQQANVGRASASMPQAEAKLIARAFSALTEGVTKLTKNESVERRELYRLIIDDNRDLREENKSLRGQLYEAEKAKQEALDNRHQRELQTEKHKEMLQVFRRLAGVAETLLPVFINKKWGLELPMPPHAHPVMEQLRQLYERVTEDEQTMLAIMQALSKNEAAMVLFGSLMSTLQDRRDLEQARARMTVAAEAGKLPEASGG